MINEEMNTVLTRTNRGTPMGELFRRYWIPALLDWELPERDCPPVRVKLLGEKLVAFRDTEGRLGLIDEFCAHRGVSLWFGRNEECGLRCLYHGWKFDVEGKCVDMSSEPGGGGSARRVMRTKAYTARESGGFVWIWMGPPEAMREFEPPAWAPHANCRTAVVKMHAACNWAQVLEGSIDSAHSSSLHSTEMPAAQVDSAKATGKVWPRPSDDKAPKLQFEPTSYGFRYAALRKPILNPETHQYVRTTLFIAPFTVLIPPNDQYNLAQMLVPIDDVNTMFYWVAWHPDATKGISQEEWRSFCAATVGVDLDANFRKIRNSSNNYQQDRQAMKRGDFTGIKGIPTQDMAMWESMGPIADRSRDHPGSSDVAVVQFRRMMVAAAKKFQEGAPAIGTAEPRTPHVQLASFEGVVPKSADWRSAATKESAVPQS
jgi:phthalate 4,5-dioxygenase